MKLITPQDIEAAARDIVHFFEESSADDNDKIKILEMVRDFYEGKDEYIVDQYLATLTQRVIDKHQPPTGFEQNG